MYEQPTSVVVDALSKSSATVFDQSTIDRILSLTTDGKTDAAVSFETVVANGGAVTVAAGTEVAYIDSSATAKTTLIAPKAVPVVVFQGQGGVNATFNDGPTTVQGGAGVVERVIVGSAGADNIVIADGKNSQITVGAGDTVVAGTGNDTVIAGLGDSTVVGGTHTVVQLGGSDSDYVVTVENGRAIVTSKDSGITTDLSKVQYVQLDNSEALVFANNTVEAAVTTLYQTAFGRTADANGLNYWFDAAKNGVALKDIASMFVQSAEFKASSLNNEAFVESLYHNTFGREGDDAGVAFWLNVLDKGVVTRADLIEQFSSTAAQHIAGTLEGEVTIVGSVTIIPGVIG